MDDGYDPNDLTVRPGWYQDEEDGIMADPTAPASDDVPAEELARLVVEVKAHDSAKQQRDDGAGSEPGGFAGNATGAPPDELPPVGSGGLPDVRPEVVGARGAAPAKEP